MLFEQTSCETLLGIMSNEDSQGLESPEQAVEGFVAEVLQGVCVEELPSVPEGAEDRLSVRENVRNKAFEMFSDAAFYKAAKRLVELLDDEDSNVAVKAASKLVDMRRDVYKTQSSKKQVKAVMNKLFDDGFDF